MWTLIILVLSSQLLLDVASFVLPKTHPYGSTFRQAAPSDTAFLADAIVSARNASCTIIKPLPKRRRFWKPRKQTDPSVTTYQFDYQYNELELVENNDSTKSMTAILLIHPIGVGIGRWFYNRLLQSLYTKRNALQNKGHTIVLAPDLLACGSASSPTCADGEQSLGKQLPLFTVTDWSNQLEQLMTAFENEHSNDDDIQWCIVSNGGCVPIALDMTTTRRNLTSVVLSAPPRLSGLLKDSSPMSKVKKSYRTLSGVVGKVFWWYALRRNGKFIQKFSETNLAADPANLGEEWTPTCVETATTFPNSRYSTFAFLSGALQTSCRPAFDALANATCATSVNVILGGDKRKNPAKRLVFFVVYLGISTYKAYIVRSIVY